MGEIILSKKKDRVQHADINTEDNQNTSSLPVNSPTTVDDVVPIAEKEENEEKEKEKEVEVEVQVEVEV